MTVLAPIWPRITRCPECSSTDWNPAGSRRWRSPPRWRQYRRCTDCGFRYLVHPVAHHVDRGGDQSDVEIA